MVRRPFGTGRGSPPCRQRSFLTLRDRSFERIAKILPQEEPEADEPEEYAPEYAAVEELEAAFEAAVEALEDGDVEGGIAALEEEYHWYKNLAL